MSLMSMRRKMASKKTITIILWVLIVVFLVGVALWSVPNRGALNSDNSNKSHYSGPDSADAVATVNGDNITVGEMNDMYNDMVSKSQMPKNFESTVGTRAQAFKDLVTRKLVQQALKKYGLDVDDGYLRQNARDYCTVQLAELRQQAQKQAEMQKQNAKPDDKNKPKSADELYQDQLSSFMRQQGGTPPDKITDEAFTNFFVDDYLMKQMAEQFADNGRMCLLGSQMIKQLPVDPLTEDFMKKWNTQEVRGQLLFVSAKKQDADSLKKALADAQKYHDQIAKDPSQFTKLAQANNSMYTRGFATMGWYQAETPMLPMMASYLLFSSKPGELSNVTLISSSIGGQGEIGYGFVLVDKSRERSDPGAKDVKWDSNKKNLMLKTTQLFQTSMGEGYQLYLHATATVVPKRHEIAVYLDEQNGETAKADEERKLAIDQDKNLSEEVKASFSYRLATSTAVKQDPKQCIPLLMNALPYAGEQTSKLHYELGVCYEQTKENDRAKEQFDNAESLAEIMKDQQTMKDIRAEYVKLNETAGVSKIDDWMKKNPAPANPRGGMGNIPINMGR